MLTISPSITSSLYSSYWSFVVHYINMISEFTIKKLDFVMVAKSVIEDIKVISPIVVKPLTILNKKDNNHQDSNIEFFQWKLRKNLETLAFLAELESRYDKNSVLPKFFDECYSLKNDVQLHTLRLTKKIAALKHVNK